MSYRTTLTIAAALVTFILVLVGNLMAQGAQARPGAPAGAPTALVATAAPAADTLPAAEPTVEPIVAPPPAEDPTVALLKQREAEYRRLIEQANERLNLANERLRVANRQQQTLVNQLRRSYEQQQALAQCSAAQP